MKNLKRVLSLALASLMLVGTMVVGAGAADYNDFTDKDGIKHTEAVKTLVALNVINGKDDGRYDPTGSLTRAEMAKLVVFVLHGGEEPALPSGSSSAFTDTANSWAKGYIEYCASTGIIKGVGNGKFDPTGTLTGSQAAKMLLVAMGYNASVFGLEGPDWEINTNVEANKAGLYKELAGIDPSATLTRDDAAQLIWNAVNGTMMERTWALDTSTGKMTETYKPYVTGGGAPITLLDTKFNAEIEQFYMVGGMTWNEAKGMYSYATVVNNTFNGSAIDTTVALTGGVAIWSENDYSALFGQKVKVVYENNTAKTVYGISPAIDDAVIVSGKIGDITGLTGGAIAATDTGFKVAGTAYNVSQASAVNVFDFNNATGTDNAGAGVVATVLSGLDLTGQYVKDYWTFDAIDNTGDGKVNTIVVYPTTVGKVTYVGTKSLTWNSNTLTLDSDHGYYTATINAVDYKIDMPEVKKGDWVALTTATIDNTNAYGEVIDVVEAKATGLDTNNTKVRLEDGEWYSYNTFYTSAPTVGTTYTMQVLNGCVVGMTAKTAAADDVLYVISSDPATGLTGIRAKVMFTDGSTNIVEINKLEGTAVASGNNVSADALYTYSVNSEGKYAVAIVAAATNTAGYDQAKVAAGMGYDAAGTGTPAKFNTNDLIADDAVFFVKSGSSSYSVISGETMKGYASKASAGTTTNYELLNLVNGVPTVKIGTMNVADEFGITKVYGYITNDPIKVVEGSTTYLTYKIWTVDGELEILDTNKDNVLAKGDRVLLDSKANGKYTSAAFDTAGNSKANVITPVAIIGYNANDSIITLAGADGNLIGAANMKLGSVKCMSVDTKNVVGVEGAEIAVSERLDDGSYVVSAYAIYSTKGDGTLDSLKGLILDVHGDIDDLANTIGTGLAGHSIAAPTISGTPAGWSVVSPTATTYACQGQVVTVSVKGDGEAATAKYDKATIAVSTGTPGATSNDARATDSQNNNLTFKCTITMGTADLSGITITLSDET